LQFSTNIRGPFQDVTGAASPYTPAPVQPNGFFRLRKTP
jgi:hypothetical protein